MAALGANGNLRAALKRVDRNNDNAVTEKEVEEALSTIVGNAQTQHAAAALIKFLDTDKDGVVSVDQLQRFLDDYAKRIAEGEDEKRGDTTRAMKKATPTSSAATTAAASTTTTTTAVGEGKK